MDMKPLEQFLCDECGQPIEKPEQGWLEWLVIDEQKQGFRIVHHKSYSPRSSGCYYEEKGIHV